MTPPLRSELDRQLDKWPKQIEDPRDGGESPANVPLNRRVLLDLLLPPGRIADHRIETAPPDHASERPPKIEWIDPASLRIRHLPPGIGIANIRPDQRIAACDVGQREQLADGFTLEAFEQE